MDDYTFLYMSSCVCVSVCVSTNTKWLMNSFNIYTIVLTAVDNVCLKNGNAYILGL